MNRPDRARPEWYRPDVDGLRAVAVVLVVGYHAGWPGFGVGLVGVDIFFVISGFVIAALLMREYDARGTVSWSSFYARRIRRLLPAAALMVVVTVGLSILLAPAWGSPWTVPLAGVAALTSTANFHYWWTWRDGIGPGGLGLSEQTPLIHTWTLAVEEQFYLVLPVVGIATLWLARGRIARRRSTPRHALLVATAVVGLASFGLALHVSGRTDPGTLYLLPFRAFEFCFGIAIALVGATLRSLAARTLLAAGGLAMLVVVLAVPERLGAYPGFMVLLPCLGAAALVLARPALLAVPPLVYLGSLSYGWYLWHLPAIELARAWNLGPVSPAAVTALALGSLVPAVLSHHLLERPLHLRRDGALSTLAVGAAVVIGLSAAGAGVAASAPEQPTRFPPVPETCRLHPADTMPRTGGRCEVTPFDAERPSIVLRGDSQAWQLLPAVLDRAVDQDLNVVAWIYPDCPPLELSDERAWRFLSGYEQDSPEWDRWADCLVANQSASLDITTLAGAGGVQTIAAASWPTYRSGADPRVLGLLDRGTRGLAARADEQSLTLVAPIPELPRSGSSCRTRMWRVTACDLDRSAADAFVDESEEWLGTVAGGVPLIDLTPDLCDDRTCSAASFLDPTRLDARRVERLAPYFAGVFERPRSVDERLDTVAEDLLGKDRGTGDRDALPQVPLGDAATGGALGADRDATAGDDHGEQVGQGGRQVQDELLGATRDPEPGGLTGQPQGDIGATRDGGGCDSECLVATLGVLGTAGDLHDELASHTHTLE